MGRPLAKRFFGNRNLGTTGTADNKIGGQGVASVGSITVGTYAAGATYPGITFSAPGIPGGVTALGTVTVRAKALAAAPFGTQTKAYQVGQVLTMGTNGTSATVATLAATTTIAADSIIADGTVTIAAAGTTTLLQGTSITFAADCIGVGGAALAATTHFVKASVTGSNTFQITDTYTKAIAGTAATYTAGDIDSVGAPGSAVATSGSTAGQLATVSTTPTAKGSYVLADTLIDAAQATAGTAPVGAGATIKVSTYEVLSVTITEKGSGYINVADAVPTFGAGTVAATGAAVLTVDTGNVGSTTNQENAIIVRAKTTGGGTVLVGEIKAQKGSHRYRVTTADGTAVCKLVATASPLVNQVCMLASDITGNDYFVMKLTSRLAVVKQKAGGANYEFADPTTFPNGEVVKWTFGTQVVNKSVKIENA